MSVIRQLNILGQMRLDVPHLRSLESSVVADFDLLAGKILSGQKPLVVRGFDIDLSGKGQAASSLSMRVAGGILMHPLASEAGTIFAVDADAPAETLSSTNSKVIGSFVAGADNYIGIDLRREADSSTVDTVMFLDANTRLEVPRSVPLARTLTYKIVISTSDFTANPHLCPIAKIAVDSDNKATTITDCRPMAYRLGSSTPAAYPWAQGRGKDNSEEFTLGDKSIGSDKDWRDAVMTRLWELGGGERWYSPASDRDVKLAYGTTVLASNARNLKWDLASQKLSWSGLSVLFANSTATHNTINNNATGVTLGDGQCLYVDLDRSTNATLTAQVGDLATLGAGVMPSSRLVLAWRKGNEVFSKDYPIEVTRDLTGIPVPTGETAKALFQGSAPGTFIWRQVEPFAAGNTGYVQFDAGEGVSGDANFFWDNTNKRLGIGTAAPSSQLHIKTADRDAAIVLEADSANQNLDSNPYILMMQDEGLISSIIGHNPGDGAGLSNGYGPDTTEAQSDSSPPTANSYTDTLKNALLIATKSQNSVQIGTYRKVALTVDTAGEVGIGTTSPTSTLHIQRTTGNASVHIQADKGDASLFLQSNTNNLDANSEGWNPYILMQQDGTDSASYVQSIIGHTGTDGKGPESTNFTGAVANALIIGTKTSNSVLQLGTNSSVALTVDGSQRVGIGTSTPNPDYKLDVNGGIWTHGNITSDATISGSYLNATNNVTSFASLQKNVYITWDAGADANPAQPYGSPAGGNWQLYPNYDNVNYTNNPDRLLFKYHSTYYTVFNGIKGYIIAQNADDVKLNFTGQHRVLSESIQKPEAAGFAGMIVVAVGKYCNVGKIVSAKEGVTINESLPSIALSSLPYSKNVFGVISDTEDPESGSREHSFGNFVSVTNKSAEDSRIIINSVGEGAIWVCDANGPLENGDYITSSEVPGHGMKQDDDLLHNYTVAKITMDCDFNPQNDEYEVVEFEHNGKKYKKAFVGCTYHCG